MLKSQQSESTIVTTEFSSKLSLNEHVTKIVEPEKYPDTHKNVEPILSPKNSHSLNLVEAFEHDLLVKNSHNTLPGTLLSPDSNFSLHTKVVRSAEIHPMSPHISATSPPTLFEVTGFAVAAPPKSDINQHSFPSDDAVLLADLSLRKLRQQDSTFARVAIAQVLSTHQSLAASGRIHPVQITHSSATTSATGARLNLSAISTPR
jgi:hypothetical protein